MPIPNVDRKITEPVGAAGHVEIQDTIGVSVENMGIVDAVAVGVIWPKQAVTVAVAMAVQLAVAVGCPVAVRINAVHVAVNGVETLPFPEPARSRDLLRGRHEERGPKQALRTARDIRTLFRATIAIDVANGTRASSECGRRIARAQFPVKLELRRREALPANGDPPSGGSVLRLANQALIGEVASEVVDGQ